jgi:hypothetical protein
MFCLTAVYIAAEEEEAVVVRCPASRRALELILSLGGLVGQGGERCWEGASVTNVTADCCVGRGKGSFNREFSLWAGQSRSSD